MKVLPFQAASACLLLLSAVSVSATSVHTWVSSTGNDTTGTGTTAKPYATFQVAITNTTAGGTVSVMGPGDYGAVVITESITIDGTGGGSINFAGANEGILLSPSAAANVVLRNLSIDGGGTGVNAIYVQSGGTSNVINVMVDGCHLSGFTGIGVAVGSQSPMYVTVRNTAIQGGQLGVRTFQSSGPTVINDHVQLDHVTVQGQNGQGVFTRNGNLDITSSTITGVMGSSPNGVGLIADTNATINVQSSMITSNVTGVCVYSGSTAIVGTSTVIADNTTNNGACGGSVQGMGGAGPAPKL